MSPTPEPLEGKSVPNVTFKARVDNQWSDAETMLRYANPAARVPEPVVMFSRPGCPHCARARDALNARGIPFTDISQDQRINASVLRAVSGASTWPQVFIGGKLIGNADAVEAHLDAGKKAG